MYKGPLKLLALLALAVGAVFALPAIASATPAPDCRNVTVHLTSRPDSGGHGPWAYDEVSRTVDVCHVPGPATSASISTIDGGKHEYETWHYRATVIDNGTFNTITGTANSPGKGVNIGHEVNGWMGGSFTATFTAPEHWSGWRGPDWNGKELAGAAGTPVNPATSTFVSALWTKGFEGSSINTDWKWTYWTCSKSPINAGEQWIDDWQHDGQGPNDGDITGKACPTPSANPTVSTTKGATVPAVTPTVSTSAGGALPVTGARTDILVIVGVTLSLIGTAVMFVLRRKRTRFEA